ncbi:Sister chromatid cohesion 1 protein 4 [Sesamum alatum]|uniref:Sister chromatid cohesion 1 protein 4 n=1 Tax=Sesamum alatum TaxID=300844 RepID=A0AAE2CSP6_9LAMI|nr:Sister chromatid cohesion 1 protein 4 [Sesamum alatum]
MFYSQFILAKKGPLGTIWIAAHLERKLRKNQVADTDIGVSVDSILFPEVPIALRLSSHLLLGVVRIYNRKVNYLFDDCSEALLKIKQAFRSTAVDLPPEESKAPYHSITLPETFDLDDFELPDSDIFQGNYVDHHISSREQITLQDTMEGVSYSTSKFGLDERFGDGDASGLDLDEELFLDKIGSAGHVVESAIPQATFGSMSPLKQDEHPEDRANNPEIMVDDVDEHADLMDYAQAPRTPGLVDEPNLSNVQDASACDDHLESDYHLMESTIRENKNNVNSEGKQEEDWCSRDGKISNAGPHGPAEENGSGGLEMEEEKPQGESPLKADIEFALSKESTSISEPSINLSGQVEAIKPVSEFTNVSEVLRQEHSPTIAVNEDKTYFLAVDETCDNHQGANEISLEKSASETSFLASTGQQVSGGASAKDLAPIGVEVSGSVGDTSNQQKSCHDGSESALENQIGSSLEAPETVACQETADSSVLNLDAHDKEPANDTLVLRPCNSNVEHPDAMEPGFSMSIHADVKPDSAALAANEMEETAALGEACCIPVDSEQNLKANQVEEHVAGADVQVETSEADGQVNNTNSQDSLVETLKKSAESELPAPEKLLSVPEGHTDLHTDILAEVSPRDFNVLDEGDTGSKTAAGRKRTFTESTLTEQSLNSVESSRQVRVKRTIGSVPDDDDLLSSILVGRRSSLLKVKPTPPLSEVMSAKRTRTAPRSGAPKRKVLMDDTMVLHGDTIRLQLTNTEDIRRVRKKAPCTLPEISMIQKQHMEDDIFLESIFTGMSVELASLQGQVYDLSRIRVCKSDASVEFVNEPRLHSQNDENGISLETIVEPNLGSENDKNGVSVETQSLLHLASSNHGNQDMKDDKGPGKTNVTEESQEEVNNELLMVGDNGADLSKNSLLIENRLEEVDCTSTEVNVSQEQVKPTNDFGVDDSQQELLLDLDGVGTGLVNAGTDNPAVIAESEPLDSTRNATSGVENASAGMVQTTLTETNSYVNMDATAVVPDQETALPSVSLDYADMDNGQSIVKNEVTEKYSDANAIGETEVGARDDFLPDVAQDAGGVEEVPTTNHGGLEYNNVQTEIYNTTSEEQREVESSYPAIVSVLEDASTNNGENLEHPEGYQPNMMDAENSGFDLHDQDELNYAAAGNDTDFLNVDDDELTEIADDMADAEDTRYTENSGWSSRTRAVSKYLQATFAKESECGKKSLSLDNLLTGKSRKEASRMFFETLVLKTRDYIHVEQRNPFDDIAIKPRTRLMKSDFYRCGPPWSAPTRVTLSWCAAQLEAVTGELAQLELGGPRAGARGTASSPGQSRRTTPARGTCLEPRVRGLVLEAVHGWSAGRRLEVVPRGTCLEPGLVLAALGPSRRLEAPASSRGWCSRQCLELGGAPLELAWGGPGRGHGTRSRHGHGGDIASAGI